MKTRLGILAAVFCTAVVFGQQPATLPTPEAAQSAEGAEVIAPRMPVAALHSPPCGPLATVGQPCIWQPPNLFLGGYGFTKAGQIIFDYQRPAWIYISSESITQNCTGPGCPLPVPIPGLALSSTVTINQTVVDPSYICFSPYVVFPQAKEFGNLTTTVFCGPGYPETTISNCLWRHTGSETCKSTTTP